MRISSISFLIHFLLLHYFYYFFGKCENCVTNHAENFIILKIVLKSSIYFSTKR